MAARDFQSSKGETWTVWDTYPTRPNATSPQHRAGWLAFKPANGDAIVCRLAPIPEGWEQVSDELLRRYLEKACSPETEVTI